MNENVIVSVIIPTYNRSSLLMDSLRSVEQQSLRNLECIIIDDGSTDDTEDIVNIFIEKDSRFKYFKRSAEYTKGACGSRNMGFDLSIGKYIQYLDDDDLLSRDKLELQVNKLEDQKSKDVFTTCDWDVYWENKDFEPKNIFNKNSIIFPSQYLDIIYKNESYIPHHAFLIPRHIIGTAGGWSTELLINADAEFIIRILINCDYLINTKKCYVLYRLHNADRMSSNFNSKSTESLIQGFKLMQTHLKSKSINNDAFFKWKLNRILLAYWKKEKNILLSNSEFFAEHGIYLSLTKFYFFKAYIYKMTYPIVKKMRVNIKN